MTREETFRALDEALSSLNGAICDLHKLDRHEDPAISVVAHIVMEAQRSAWRHLYDARERYRAPAPEVAS